MKLVKLYTWRNDVLYFLLLPKFLFKALIGIAKGDHKLNDFNSREYVSLWMSFCDAAAGRLYRMEDTP